MCKNVLCWKRNRARGPCNEVRLIEFVLCILSLAMTIYFWRNSHMSMTILLVQLCAIIFIFITLVDIIVITIWFPIGWRAWILISLTASLLFLTSAGLSFLIAHQNYWLSTLVNIITGLVFLLDALCIIRLVRGIEEIPHRSCPSISRSSQIIPVSRPADLESAPPIVLQPPSLPNYHDQQTQYTASSRYAEYQRVPPPVSYGGTFHMSKDTAPMPSPESVIISFPECEENDTVEIQYPEMTAGNVRTVAVMAKVMPRKISQVDLTPLKSPFQPDNEIKVNRPPPKKLKRVQFMACRDLKSRDSTTTTNSPRSTNLNDSDRSSSRNSPMILSKNKV